MASADKVSPFFTKIRVLVGFEATVLEEVPLFDATVADVFGFEPLDEVTATRGLEPEPEEVVGF
jgi:hypothetical protein